MLPALDRDRMDRQRDVRKQCFLALNGPAASQAGLACGEQGVNTLELGASGGWSRHVVWMI
jgi:hypothetical protein